MTTNKTHARMVVDIDDPWRHKAIGEPVAIFDDIAGVSAPPTDQDYRYVLLTAGEDGSGEYNEGVLTSESVTGSAPSITATAVVDLSGSPLDGQTVRLINTERRFLRAGSAGTTQNSQNAEHNHNGSYEISNDAGVNPRAAPGGGFSTNGTVTTSNSGGDEARPRNVGVTYYMRIK